MRKLFKKNIVNTELYVYCALKVLYNFATDMLRYKFNGEKASEWVPVYRGAYGGRVYFFHEGKRVYPDEFMPDY